MNWQTFIEDYKKEHPLLFKRVDEAYKDSTVYPPKALLFHAFELTAFDAVKVVILGQDPYHKKHQAMGLAFSVPKGQSIPPSLNNIYKELHNDLNEPIPSHGDLTQWAKQGVFLLNTYLTVLEGQPLSHSKIGWESFTDAVLLHLSKREEPIIFVLWGQHARSKKALIDTKRHVILEASHPSPLSARHSFFGSAPFSKINSVLVKQNKSVIDFSL